MTERKNLLTRREALKKIVKRTSQALVVATGVASPPLAGVIGFLLGSNLRLPNPASAEDVVHEFEILAPEDLPILNSESISGIKKGIQAEPEATRIILVDPNKMEYQESEVASDGVRVFEITDTENTRKCLEIEIAAQLILDSQTSLLQILVIQSKRASGVVRTGRWVAKALRTGSGNAEEDRISFFVGPDVHDLAFSNVAKVDGSYGKVNSVIVMLKRNDGVVRLTDDGFYSEGIDEEITTITLSGLGFEVPKKPDPNSLNA